MKMARRCLTLLVAAAALVAARDADCLGDGASCPLSLGCPQVCCTGVASRTTSGIMHCPSFSAVMHDEPSLTPAPSSSEGSSAWEPASSTNGSTSPEEATPTPVVNDNASAANATAPTPNSQTTPAIDNTPTPTVTQKTDSVSAFQSSQGLAGSRSNGGSTAFVVVGALAGCVVLVAAVMYKRKNATNSKDLEVPGSAYQGAAGGSGLTPDNRTLDSIVDARASNESMKMLPVLSMTKRDLQPARPSSPFGHGVARISSPAQRGLTNEDFAFEVENGARPGSSVQVAFVDASADSTEFVPEKNGVVAL